MELTADPQSDPIADLPRRRFLRSAALGSHGLGAAIVRPSRTRLLVEAARALAASGFNQGGVPLGVLGRRRAGVTDGYAQYRQLLRDVGANAAVQTNPTSLDILYGIYGWFAQAGLERPILVTSGYRTQALPTAWVRPQRNPSDVTFLASVVDSPTVGPRPPEIVGTLCP